MILGSLTKTGMVEEITVDDCDRPSYSLPSHLDRNHGTRYIVKMASTTVEDYIIFASLSPNYKVGSKSKKSPN